MFFKIKTIRDMPVVYEDLLYTVRADQSGYWLWHNQGDKKGYYTKFETIEAMCAYTGYEITEPGDLIRVTAARFSEPEKS